MRRKRYQKGSLQKTKKHGKHLMWILQYREGGTKQYHTVGPCSKFTKSQAQEAQATFMKEVNARGVSTADPHATFEKFLEGMALPFYRLKWKRSTRFTTEGRIRYHLIPEFGQERLSELNVKRLQSFLTEKADKCSESVVAHLRWDLRAIFRLAMAEGYIHRDPTAALFTPKDKRVRAKKVMTGKEAEKHINALGMRERVIDHLALFVGMRPGEILALQRRHVSLDCSEVTIEQGLYRGIIDDPKTKSSNRVVGIPSGTATVLREWMAFVGVSPDAWVFASENPTKPLWRDNVWRRNMLPKLTKVGLEWANFQVLRRTHASLSHEAGIDPKVSADQRGHGIGVALDVYTHSSVEARRKAAEALERSIKGSSDDKPASLAEKPPAAA